MNNEEQKVLTLGVDGASENHRCLESRLYHVRIKKNFEEYGFVYRDWNMFPMIYDCDWNTWRHARAIPINFCPFCGKEL